VVNSIFANSPSGGDCVNNGTFSTNINNLVEDGSCNPAFSGDPGLSGLQNNGGPTRTHYPLASSIVIDSGDEASCLDRDQRGMPRPFDGNEDGTAVCDIGSVERVAIFVVNSANDVSTSICNESHCSLREAIEAANSSYGTDLILFDIPGQGPHTIQPQSPLPNIAGPVLIDGYSQSGAVENTQPGQPGGNTVLMIELDGTNAGSAASGLMLVRSFSDVRGLAINSFGQHGIRIVGPNAKGNVVAGNYIGADVNGNGSPGNGAANVFIGSGASSNIIGGDGAADGNIIAFAGSSGVIIDGVDSSGNEVRSNAIYSNGLLGIDLGQDGVTNNDAGDVDAGPNGLQNYPELFLATADVGQTIISGSLSSTASTGYTLEFFANSACDASGNGEGERPIGTANVVTDGSGEVSFEVSVPYETPLDEVISATATDQKGSSSEFSPCMSVVDAPISGLVASNSSPTMDSLPTQLVATITTGGNVNYEWDFGDGEGGVGGVASHIYPAEGVFTAVVTASNSINMLMATTVVTITEYIPSPPTDVSLTVFGRDWTGVGGVVWPVAVGVVVLGMVVVAFLGRRRER
jgi:CSLREA domain-containing protein